MTKNNSSESIISMGKLQANMESSAKSARASERALKRAQDARDSAVTLAASARQAFVDGIRVALG